LDIKEELEAYINGEVDNAFKKLLQKHKILQSRLKELEKSNRILSEKITKMEEKK